MPKHRVETFFGQPLTRFAAWAGSERFTVGQVMRYLELSGHRITVLTRRNTVRDWLQRGRDVKAGCWTKISLVPRPWRFPRYSNWRREANNELNRCQPIHGREVAIAEMIALIGETPAGSRPTLRWRYRVNCEG